MKTLNPHDHRESVALFRAEIIGALTRRALDRGALKAELKALSLVAHRMPGAKVTRRFSVATLERWYYAYRKDGLEGLMPKARSDRGVARALNEELRELLLGIRRECPKASAELIIETLVAEGGMAKDQVSARVMRRFFQAEGLDRVARASAADGHARRRWEAAHPGALWQADVCHGPSLMIDGRNRPLRVHAIIDDASRFIIALEAHHTEQERDMLDIFANAIRRHGPPGAIYLDNGSTYSGDALRLCCERLGVTLVHSKAYQPQGRGKIERFFRTLRAHCLDYVDTCTSLHAADVQRVMLEADDRSEVNLVFAGGAVLLEWQGFSEAPHRVELEALSAPEPEMTTTHDGERRVRWRLQTHPGPDGTRVTLRFPSGQARTITFPPIRPPIGAAIGAAIGEEGTSDD